MFQREHRQPQRSTSYRLRCALPRRATATVHVVIITIIPYTNIEKRFNQRKIIIICLGLLLRLPECVCHVYCKASKIVDRALQRNWLNNNRWCFTMKTDWFLMTVATLLCVIPYTLTHLHTLTQQNTFISRCDLNRFSSSSSSLFQK